LPGRGRRAIAVPAGGFEKRSDMVREAVERELKRREAIKQRK
jgi:Arc/MetJ-type ribon-helix-helix transcriptional regulator